MTKATVVKTTGTVLSLVLAFLGWYFRANPTAAATLALVSTNLVSWLHLPTPGTVRLSDLLAPSSDPPPP